MSVIEIALLVVGVIIFVISFLIPDGEDKKTEKQLAAEKEEVHRLVEQEIDGMKLRVNEATNDTVEYAVEKAERSLEKVSNEKIMAVNEYAGTILEEINKNHKEVMFLYDMLNDKQTDLNNAVRKADATVKEIENVSHSAQNASETLLRGMSVATVSQKGLTKEQKAVFDDLLIPDAQPVVFKNHEQPQAVVSNDSTSASKPRAVALAQSKIFAGLTGQEEEAVVSQTAPVNASKPAEKVVYDILSGGAYKEGNVVNVDNPAGGSVTAADFSAMIENSGLAKNSGSVATNPININTQAPANNNDMIIQLSKQGLGIVEIAKSLNLGVGEVKLVLDLFK